MAALMVTDQAGRRVCAVEWNPREADPTTLEDPSGDPSSFVRCRASAREPSSHIEAALMRRAHRFFGLLAVVPLLAWLVSGVALVVVDPGPPEGTDLLLPMRPLGRSITVRPEPGVQEVRLFSTVLGQHLIQRTEFGWRHLDPLTGELKPIPAEEDLRALLEEAFVDSDGFGEISLVAADSLVTTTGRVITLDWSAYRASYRDETTRLAAILRRVHGLGLSGIRAVDRWSMIVAGVLGSALALLGLGLLLREEGAPEKDDRRS